MHLATRPHTGVAATGIALIGIAAMAATPLGPPSVQSPPAVSQEVRLAADAVPPGGIVTTFLGNQVIYCSIICPLLVETGATAVGTALTAPATFATALQSGDLLEAIGVAAASVTGPTNAAATTTIVADGTLVAPRVLNAFEVGVVGLLDVVPAAAGGLPGIAAAIEAARQATFAAQHAPIVPNPAPIVMPHGVVQVAVVGAINIGAAVIFPAFNDVLNAATEVPDAAAQELAASGDPVRAASAGITTAAGALTSAAGVVADSVVNAANDIRATADQRRNETAQVQNISNTTASVRHISNTAASVRPKLRPPRRTTTTQTNVKPGSARPLRNLVSTVRNVARTVTKTASDRPHRAASSRAADK